MLLKHAREGKVQVLANILLKVNAKLGGRNAVPGKCYTYFMLLQQQTKQQTIVITATGASLMLMRCLCTADAFIQLLYNPQAFEVS
jgi:hypothetical protein